MSDKTKGAAGNDRMTGARKFPLMPEKSDQDAADITGNPPQPYGLTEPLEDHNEKTRHSDGEQPRERRK